MTNPLGLIGYILVIGLGLLALGSALMGTMSGDHTNVINVVLGFAGYFAAWAAALFMASKS